jgi:crotonobetainyl-CoA:carnitine CoA-transferase CaiB-like acyl-CoA transferase
MTDQTSNSGALSGIRVLDLSTIILGPMAAQYLGDMGADVIKIENPVGDLTRYVGPARSHGMGAFFMSSNRNKRSVVIDLKREDGRQLLKKLIAKSDVVLHSIRKNSAEKLGLSYETLSAINPRIILAHAKGYSDDGLNAGMAAYDDVMQAVSGLASLQAVVAGEPRYIPTIVADKITAVHTAYGISMALLHRERTGRGQQVDIPMMETMVAFNTVEHLWGATFVPGLAGTGYVPISTAARRPFKSKDGYVCVLPYTDDNWASFCRIVGDPALTEDPRYKTHAARQKDQQGFWNEVGRRVLERTSDEWIAALNAADVPVGRVNSLDDLLTDPHLESVGFWQTMTHPTEGALRVPQPPLGFSDSPASIRRLQPNLGQHTEEVLREIGLSADEIARLDAEGITRAQPRARPVQSPVRRPIDRDDASGATAFEAPDDTA